MFFFPRPISPLPLMCNYTERPTDGRSGVRLKELSEAASDQDRWDAFVLAHPEGTFFHRAGWRSVIGKVFGHGLRYVYTERDGDITGVLPLVHLRSRIFGSALVSTPFCVQGGPLATDPDSLDRLRTYAVAEMERLGVRSLEFRLNEASGTPGWVARTDQYAVFRRSISENDEQNLKSVPRKQRAVIRKSLESALVTTSEPDIKRFHRIYSESLRNLGTPAFPHSYFQALVDEFGEACEITTVAFEDQPVSTVLSFFFRDEVLPYYGGAVPLARSCGAYDRLYWEVMRRAAARGCRVFDFGRSKVGTGSYAFKKNWGFMPQPLTYEYRLLPGASLPDLNPLNPKYKHYIAAWKRLPLPIANLVGPYLVRSLG